MNAQQHLQGFGISLDAAEHFLGSNVGRPDVIHQVCRQYAITNEMLAEITGYSVADVQYYWAGNGFDPWELDAQTPARPDPVMVYMPVEIDDWDAGAYNHLAYSLEYPGSVGFEGATLAAGQVFHAQHQHYGYSEKHLTVGSIKGQTPSDDAVLTFAFSVEPQSLDHFSVLVHDVSLNGRPLNTALYTSVQADLLELEATGSSHGSDGYETLTVDSSGYATSYFNIQDVLTLPDARVFTLEPDEPQQAYVHVNAGESFAFDHDTFRLDVDYGQSYRLKVTPDDPSVFTSNQIAWLYGPDGEMEDLIMNEIEGFHTDGSLYSAIFTAESAGQHFLSLSLRWAGEYGDVATGPEPYTIELMGVETGLL